MPLFPNPIRCANSQCSSRVDFRNYPGTLEIPDELTRQIFAGDVGTISSLSGHSTFLTCPNCSTPVPIGDVPGVFYHPGRQKWIVWHDGDPYADRRGSAKTGVLCDSGKGLTLEFAPHQVEFVRAIDIMHRSLPGFRLPGDKKAMQYPVLPVRREYLDLIDFKKLDAFRAPRIEPDGRITYTIPLLGSAGQPYRHSYLSEQVVAVDETFLEIWPRLPKWRAYWLTCAVGVQSADTEQWRVEAYAPSRSTGIVSALGVPDSVPADENRTCVETQLVESWPTIIHLSEVATKSDVGGAFVIPPPVTEAANEGSALISLDFGTSRTVVMVSASSSNDPDSFAHFANRAMVKNTNKNDFQQGLETRGFKPAGVTVLDGAGKWRIMASHSPTTSIPKYELRNEKADGPSVLLIRSMTGWTSGVPFGPVPFRDFTLPPVLMDGLQEKPAEKWSLGGTQQFVKGFLKAALLLAAVEAQQKYTTGPSFSFSYPLAFNRDQKERFAAYVEEAVRFVNDLMPLDAQIAATRDEQGKIRPFPESLAAFTAAKVTGASNVDRAVAVADLGGGTLDVGFWFLSRDQDDSELDRRLVTPLVSDSVRMGADYVLKTFLHVFDQQSQDTDIRWSVYTEGYRKGLAEGKHRYAERPQWAKKFKPAVQEWLAHQVEYIARGLGPLADEKGIKEIRLVLAGGGWKSVEALGWGPAELQKETKELIEKRLKALLGHERIRVLVFCDLLKSGLEKIAVAGGLQALGGHDKVPDGVVAPNGVDETEPDGKPVPWKKAIGGAAAGRAAQWPGGTLVVSDKGNVEPPIPGMNNTIGDSERARIETQVSADGPGREHTALSFVMEYVAMEKLGR